MVWSKPRPEASGRNKSSKERRSRSINASNFSIKPRLLQLSNFSTLSSQLGHVRSDAELAQGTRQCHRQQKHGPGVNSSVPPRRSSRPSFPRHVCAEGHHFVPSTVLAAFVLALEEDADITQLTLLLLLLLLPKSPLAEALEPVVVVIVVAAVVLSAGQSVRIVESARKRACRTMGETCLSARVQDGVVLLPGDS